MSIIAERTDTVYLSETTTKFGVLAGAVIEAAIFDPSNGQWMADWSAGTWQAVKATQVLTENPESPGRHGFNAVFTGTANSRFIAMFEVIAGGQGGSQKEVVIVDDLYAVASQASVGYQGSIWIDTVNGSPGTEVGVNGTTQNKVSSLADAVVLAAATGLRRYHISGNIVLTSPHVSWEFMGTGTAAQVNLNSQDVGDSFFHEIEVVGTQGGAGNVASFTNCRLTDVVGFHGEGMHCAVDKTIGSGGLTLRSGGICKLVNTRSVQNLDVNVNNGTIQWSGITGYTRFSNITSGTSHSIVCEGGTIEFNSTNTGGTVSVGGVGTLNDFSASMLVIGELLNPTAIDVELTAQHSAGAWVTGAGGLVEQQVRDAMLLSPTPGTPGAGSIDEYLDTIDQDTSAMQPVIAANLDVSVSSRQPSGAVALIQAALDGVRDAVLDAPNANHLIPASIGFNQDQAAQGGAGVTPIQIEQAVWRAEQVDYQDDGSMGKAVSDGASLPSDLVAAIDRYFKVVRRYGPIIVRQPIASKDEIHAGDKNIILTIPVTLDGDYTDLADATSIDFEIVAPDGTIWLKPGAGVTTPTGSYTTWPSDSDVFTTTGRWVAKVTVTWPDFTLKQSIKYPLDVQSPL